MPQTPPPELHRFQRLFALVACAPTACRCLPPPHPSARIPDVKERDGQTGSALRPGCGCVPQADERFMARFGPHYFTFTDNHIEAKRAAVSSVKLPWAKPTLDRQDPACLPHYDCRATHRDCGPDAISQTGSLGVASRRLAVRSWIGARGPLGVGLRALLVWRTVPRLLGSVPRLLGAVRGTVPPCGTTQRPPGAWQPPWSGAPCHLDVWRGAVLTWDDMPSWDRALSGCGRRFNRQPLAVGRERLASSSRQPPTIGLSPAARGVCIPY